MNFAADFFVRWLEALWLILVEAGIWLLAGFIAAGLLHALISRAWIERQLSGKAGVWKAALLGAPIPLCSCSVIPFAAGVRARGASKGSSASLAISSPEIDIPAFGLTWALLGPAMAILRPIAALISALTAGLLIDRAASRNPERTPAASAPAQKGTASSCCSSAPTTDQIPASTCCETKPASCCSTTPPPADDKSCCSTPAPASPGGSPCCSDTTNPDPWWTRALRYSFITLPRDLGLWMGIGLALSALILAAIPPDWIQANLTGGELGAWTSRALMLLIGIPLYVCATASTPLVAALLAAGLSPGAGLIFLLAGPATNPATMAWVLKDLGVRALAIYLGVIATVAFAAGTIVDYAMPAAWFAISEAFHEHAHFGPVDTAAGAVLAALLGYGILSGIGGKVRPFWGRRVEAV